jgi:hypothetical protein
MSNRSEGLSKLVLTEQGSGWIPGVLDMLEYYHQRLVGAATRVATAESKFGAGLAELMGDGPRAAWERNCFVGASFMRAHEVPLRDRIGLDKIMWGSDFPHDEGTYPFTTEALRTSFAGVPYAEVAAMTGGNAARVYGFDLEALDPIAAKVGPLVAEVTQPLTEAPPGATSPSSPRAPRSGSGETTPGRDRPRAVRVKPDGVRPVPPGLHRLRTVTPLASCVATAQAST